MIELPIQVAAVSPAFACDRTLLVGGRGGLARSTDGGRTWSMVLTGDQVLEEAAGADTRVVGLRVLARALAEPLRVLVGHAGYDAGAIVAEGRRRGPGWTFDVVRGAWVEAWSSGLVDAAAVVAAGLEASVSGACASLSVEGLICRVGPGV